VKEEPCNLEATNQDMVYEYKYDMGKDKWPWNTACAKCLSRINTYHERQRNKPNDWSHVGKDAKQG
jgi:hypothetical protein